MMNKIKAVLSYLKENHLILTTAESCTAGQIIHLLAKIPGSGECLDAGFVVYSENAKKRILNVKQNTIDDYTLTSEEVAREMAQGALKHSLANVVVATTGLCRTWRERWNSRGNRVFCMGVAYFSKSGLIFRNPAIFWFAK